MICPKCGTNIPTGDVCDYCGYRVKGGFFKRRFQKNEPKLHESRNPDPSVENRTFKAKESKEYTYEAPGTENYYNEETYYGSTGSTASDSSAGGDSYYQNTMARFEKKAKPDHKALRILLIVLGFIFPWLGLIFFILFHHKNPEFSKKTGKAAAFGILTQVMLTTVIPAVIAAILSAFSMDEQAWMGSQEDPSSQQVMQLEEYPVEFEFGSLTFSDPAEGEDIGSPKLIVTITNTAGAPRKYAVTFAIRDKENNIIAQDYLDTEELKSGEAREYTLFDLCDLDEELALYQNREELSCTVEDIFEISLTEEL